MRMRFVLFISTSFLLLIFVGCQGDHDTREESVRFTVTNPIRKDTSLIREYVCQIRAIQHIEVRALERGYLEKILVDEGQLIRKGQQMFQILPIVYQAEFKQAAAEARVAEIEYLNTKALADSNVVSKNELALAKARYDKAQAEMALAQAHLGFTKITAPFDGIMDRLNVRLGSLLEEGEILTTLSDNRSMWVYFNVPEAQYLNFKSSKSNDSLIPVMLRMANNELFAQPGMVTTIEADFNSETGNIAFRATFPNKDGLLRHGETGNILMKEDLKNVLLIPQKATFEILDKLYVYVIGKDHKVRSRQIKVIAELPHLYAVSDGIAEDDTILLEGIRKVRENQRIEYRHIGPDSAISHLQLFAE